jgi:hypothetical protein
VGRPFTSNADVSILVSDFKLFSVLDPAQELFTYMKANTGVKGCKLGAQGP